MRRITITAGSPLEARRLADAMGPALEGALTRVVFEGTRASRLLRPADNVAERIAEVIEARLRGRP
jgi:hypothetical protein